MAGLPCNLIAVGRLGRPHGLRGFNKLQSFTRPEDNILNYTPWYVGGAEPPARVAVAGHRHAGGVLIVRIEGVTDRDAAAALTGAEILVERRQLPPAGADEVYWVDLLGCRVYQDERCLGEVVELMEAGEHDALVVRDPQGRERLIPFVEGLFVRRVDLHGRRIDVAWDDEG